MDNENGLILPNDQKASYPSALLSQKETQSFQLILQIPLSFASIFIGCKLLNECDSIKLVCIYLIIQGISAIILVSLRLMAIYFL